MQAASKAFFQLPIEEKESYANEAQNPIGYGSKLGYSADSEAKLDWGDYYLNGIWPPDMRDMKKWPTQLSDFTYTLIFFQIIDLRIRYLCGNGESLEGLMRNFVVAGKLWMNTAKSCPSYSKC